MRPGLAVFLLMAAGLAACGLGPECNAGDAQRCSCPQGGSGTQVCGGDGEWGTCSCSRRNINGGGGGGGNENTASSSSSSGGGGGSFGAGGSNGSMVSSFGGGGGGSSGGGGGGATSQAQSQGNYGEACYPNATCNSPWVCRSGYCDEAPVVVTSSSSAGASSSRAPSSSSTMSPGSSARPSSSSSTGGGTSSSVGGSGPNNNGGACTLDADCTSPGGGTFCVTDFPGGYCSGACSTDMDCGTGARCINVGTDSLGNPTSACLKACIRGAISTTCRVEYMCAELQNDAVNGVCFPRCQTAADCTNSTCDLATGECI